MRIEPSIDAFGVKHMVAFGDQSEILNVFEFIETNSALKCTFSDLQTRHHRIHESWECPDHRRVILFTSTDGLYTHTLIHADGLSNTLSNTLIHADILFKHTDVSGKPSQTH
ncbi:unnamed protein product [Camellia sinensis]